MAQIVKIQIKAKRMKYGYKALGKQSNQMMLTPEQNLARLKKMLGLEKVELVG